MASPALTYTADEVKTALMAILAWNGNVPAARRDLENTQGMFISDDTLRAWVNRDHAIEYQRLRDEHGADLEANLAHEFRHVAGRAVEVQMLALEQAKRNLEEGRDSEPAKTASFAARAGASAVDKLMTLTNRPEKIVETRDVNDVLRSLAARKIIRMIPETVVDGSAEPDDDQPREPSTPRSQHA